MTLEQIARLTETLDIKVEEGLKQLKEVSIGSPTFNTILSNIITSTTLAEKIRMDKTQTTEGEN